MSAPMSGPGVGSNTRAGVVLINGPSVQSIALARVMALFSNTASPTTRGRVYGGDRGYGENRFTAPIAGPSPVGGAVRPVSHPLDVIGSTFPSFPNAGYDVDPSVGMLNLGQLTNMGWN